MQVAQATPQETPVAAPASTSGLFSGKGAETPTPFEGAPADLPVTPAPAEATTPAEVPEIVVGEKEEPQVAPDPSRENEFKYDPTGNASLDYALNFIGELGFGPAHPAVMAAQDGNFHLIAAELAREGVAGAEQVIALAKEAYEVEKGKHANAKQEIAKFAFDAAGGADNWSNVQAWASANATPAEKAQINNLLAAGGLAAQSAINFLVQQYDKTNTRNKAPASVARPNAASSRGADVSGGPLSAQEYGQAVNQLIRASGGRDVTGSPEYQDLQSRRLQGMRSGR